MADFCNQCAAELGFPAGDLDGLTTPDDWLAGLAAVALCEGCGPIQVDPEGNCVSLDCVRKHGRAMPDRIYAPWDARTAAALNRWQSDGRVHPFTCPDGHTLRAVAGGGWVCDGCSYTQDWAWIGMVAGELGQ